MLEEKRELTFGEKAVGVSFNPSFMKEVDEVKSLFAKAIDVMEAVHANHCDSYLPSWLRNVLRTAAVNACIAASSSVVKYLTWKD